MDYPVKHFESDDAGAPSLDRTLPGSLIQVLKQCLIEGYNLQPFDSLETEEGEGKANFPGNHGFRLHQVISISGAAGSAWNGEHRVTAVGTQWIRFEVEGEPAGESGSGLEIKAAPAGGWAMPLISAEEDRAAFRSDDPSGSRMFWYLDDRRTADIESPPGGNSTNLDFRLLLGAEDMPDIDTRVDDWGDGWVFVGSSAQGDVIPYDIIADDRTVYLITHPINDTGTYRTVHAFGDFVSGVPGDPYAAFLVLANAGDADDTDDGLNCSYWGDMSATAHKWLARDHAGAEPITFRLIGSSAAGNLGNGGFDYPNPANLELFVHAELLIAHGSTLRGRAPGVAQPLHPTPLASREAARVAGRLYKAISHAATVTTTPAEGQTFFDLTGPWR
ncbi:hypothetical protein [Halomonas sp. SL1]|uniref:hypothetical protein n=1 Tax=Halomonas sp. SL1 TaxID=2137478 RepID=UPI000D15B72D|nr:hypothetical protein [Halomonas sp. SL1]RAH37407.1 hypothetical protein C9J49_010925 [Halomonas sp. SL1]